MADINNYDTDLNPGDPFKEVDLKLKQNNIKDAGPVILTGDPSILRGVNLKEYTPYLGESILIGQDINRLRAERQPFREQVGRAAINLPGSIIGGIVENAGYIGTLLTEWGDDRDYTNSLTEAGKGIKDWWKSSLGGDVYRLNPEKVWDVMDSGWWIQNAEGLVESIGEFAVTGFGVGSLLGKGAAALANVSKSAALSRGLMGAAKWGTAGTLAYTEGAISGAEVYKETYGKEYARLMKLPNMNEAEAMKQAKHKAATAAATTVQLNTTINTFLNVGSIAPMFRSTNYLAANSAKAAGKKNAMNIAEATVRQADDKIDDIIARTSNVQFKPTPFTPNLVVESFKEGIEEQVNLFAEQSGKRVGEMKDDEFAKYEYNNWMSYLNQFEQLGNFAKDVYTEEGALNFVLGAFGGIGQTAIMEYAPLPFNKIPERNPNTGEIIPDTETGKPKYKYWVSNRKKQKMNEEIAFNKLKNSVVADLKDFNQKSTELNNLLKNEDNLPANVLEQMVEDKRQELFNLEAYRSIKNGVGDYLKGTFEYIAGLDNTNPLSKNLDYQKKLENLQEKLDEELAKPEDEQDKDLLTSIRSTKDRLAAAMNNPEMTQAMYEGYAEKPNTDLHKKRAENAIEKIDEYTKDYHDVMSRYNFGDEETLGLAKTLWNYKININNNKRKIERDKNLIEREKARLQESSGTTELSKISSILAEAASKQAEIEAIEKQLNDFNEGLETVLTSKRSSTEYKNEMEKLMSKYESDVIRLKAEGRNLKGIEKELIKIEQFNLGKEVKTLEERKEKLTNEKIELFELEETTKNSSYQRLNKEQLDSLVENYDQMVKFINGQIDNKFQQYHEQILKNELDVKFINDEYVKLSSSKGRAEFVKNGREFYKRMKEYGEKREREETAAAEKEEKKMKGLFYVEKTEDGKFSIFDSKDKVVETFDTEEDANKRIDELNKEVEEKKKKEEEEKKRKETTTDFATEQHFMNVSFLESLLNENESDLIDDINKVTNDLTKKEEELQSKQQELDGLDLTSDPKEEIKRKIEENQQKYEDLQIRQKKELDELNKKENKNYISSFDILNVNEYSEDQSPRSQEAIDLANRHNQELKELLDEKYAIEEEASKISYSDYDLSDKQELLDKLKKEIDNVYFKNKQALEEGFAIASQALNEALQVGGDQYVAHGMAKAALANSFSALIELFSQGINPLRGRGKLDVAPLAGGVPIGTTTSGNAYMDGAFTLVANKEHQGAISNINQIGGIIVNEGIATPEVLDTLRKLFPNLVIESTSNTKSLVEQLNKKYDLLQGKTPTSNADAIADIERRRQEKLKKAEEQRKPKIDELKAKAEEDIKRTGYVQKITRDRLDSQEGLLFLDKDKIHSNSDAEYIDAVKKGTMTKEQAMQALEKVGRKDSSAYAELTALEGKPTAEQKPVIEKSQRQINAEQEITANEKELNNAFNIEDNISFFESELDKVKKEISKRGLTKDRQLKLDAINSTIALLKNSKSYDEAFDKHVFEKNPIKLTKESTSEEIQKSDDWNKFQQYRQDLMDIPYLVRNELNTKIKENKRIIEEEKSKQQRKAARVETKPLEDNKARANELSRDIKKLLEEIDVLEKVKEELENRLETIDTVILSADEFLKEYKAYSYNGKAGQSVKLSFLKNYLDLFKLAEKNGTTFRITDDPNDDLFIYINKKVITINLARVSNEAKKTRLDLQDSKLSELVVHEIIHSFVGNELNNNPAFAKDLKTLIINMSNSKGNNLNKALDEILDNISSDIASTNKLPNSPEKDKKIKILQESFKSINYIKETIKNTGNENQGIEEFITQALSIPEFAYYLNTLPSEDALENGPSISVWQMLKRILLNIINTVLNNKSKLQELNNILDKHLSKTTEGLSLMDVENYFDLGLVLNPGIYVFQDENIVLHRTEGDNVIFSFVDEISKEIEMSKKDFFNEVTGINEDQFVNDFSDDADKLNLADENLNKKIEDLKTKHLYNYLNTDSKNKIDQKIEQILNSNQELNLDKKGKEILNDIKSSKTITKIQELLSDAKNLGLELEIFEKESLKKIKEISKTVNDFNDDNYIKLANIADFDEIFQNMLIELSEIKEEITNTLFEDYKKKIRETTDLKELIDIRKKYTKYLKERSENFKEKLARVSKLGNSEKELENEINDIDINLLKERLDREFVLRLSDDEMKTKGVQYAHVIKNGIPQTKRLYKIAGATETGYILVPDKVDVNDEAKVSETGTLYPYSDVINYSDKNSFINGFSNKEELFNEEYAKSILFENIAQPEATKEFIEFMLRYNIQGLRSDNNTAHNKAMIKAKIINMFPTEKIVYDVLKEDNLFDVKKILKKLINDVSNDALTDDEVNKLISDASNAILKDKDFQKTKVVFSGSDLFSNFLNSLLPSEKNETLGNKIRVTVSKATKAKQLSNKMKSKSKNNIDEKLRLGIIVMNSSKKESYDNNEEVIGIHRWEDISVDYEINIGTKTEPKWVKIGSARNPYAYKAIQKEKYSEISKSPAHLYENYLKETDNTKREEIINEFNRLYSVSKEPVSKEKFESIGKAWLNQKTLYDVFSKLYNEKGEDKLSFSAEELKSFIHFNFTSGNFDFIKNPKFRNTFKSINTLFESKNEKNNPFKLQRKVKDKDGKEITISEYAIFDVEKSDSERQVFYNGEYISLPDSAFYGKYWLLIKDIKGDYKFLWLKPKKADDTYINDSFIKDINKHIEDYNNGTINKDTLLLRSKDAFRSIYFTLPNKDPNISVDVNLRLTFDKATNKVLMRPDGSPSTFITVTRRLGDLSVEKLEQERGELFETETPYLKFDVDVTSLQNFKNSLFTNSRTEIEKIGERERLFTPITEDNIRVSFEKINDFLTSTNQSKIVSEDYFEIAVSDKIFKDHRLITTIGDNLTLNNLKNKLYGEEIVEEEEVEEEDILSDLSEDEKNLVYMLKEVGIDSAINFILETKDDKNLNTKKNLKVKEITEKLKFTTKEKNEVLKLLVDIGYLIKYNNTYKVNPDYKFELAEEEGEEIIIPEELGEELGEDLTFIDDLNSRNIQDGADIIFDIDDDILSELDQDLSSDSGNPINLQKVKDRLKELYKDDKFKNMIDQFKDIKKKGRVTVIEMDDSTLNKMIKGCPKFT